MLTLWRVKHLSSLCAIFSSVKAIAFFTIHLDIIGRFMSKLIKDVQPPPVSSQATLLPLNNGDVELHLQACKKLTLSYLEHALATYIKALLEALTWEVDNAKTNQEAVDWMEVSRLVKSKTRDIVSRFYTCVSLSFDEFGKKKPMPSDSVSVHNKDGLSLIAKHVIEENIIIATVIRHVDAKVAEHLWVLNQRLSVLKHGEPVHERNNPVAPVLLCEALRGSLVLLPPEFKIKKLAYSVFAKVLLPLSFKLMDAMNSYLQKHGILPNMKEHSRDSSSDGSKDTSQSNDSDVLANKESAETDTVNSEYESQLMTKIRHIQKQDSSDRESNSVSADTVTDLLAVLQDKAPDLSNILLNLDESQITSANVSVDNLIKQLQVSVSGQGVKGYDLHIINLVGMLFNFMLNDENLPVSVKALLSYLHTPFLKIAFVDTNFFEQSQHPARLLINTLTEAGARWVSSDGVSEFDMYNRIKDVVMRIHSASGNEVKLVTELLLEFRSNLKQIQRKQDLTEKRAKEKARGEDRLRETKIRVNTEIRERIRNKELPSAVLLFLLQPWTDYLSFSYLRHGDGSKDWLDALTVVDNLVWSIEPKLTDEDQQLHAESYPNLLKSISAGLNSIGFPSGKKESLISAISSIIELALKQEKVEPAPGAVRDELERKAAEKAGEMTVKEDEPTKDELKMMENLKIIEFGTWLEFSGGKRLKVAWRNSRNGEYMLVNQMGQRADMISPLALSRIMLAGKVKVISGSAKPFFERALENIYENLNQVTVNISDAGSEGLNNANK